MRFTHNGNTYHVIETPWTGVWVVSELGVAYRTLVDSGQEHK